jgi:hypothetical protein
MGAGPVNRRDRAIAQRLKVWPLLDAGLCPIPVHPEARKPYKGLAWGELDRLGRRPGVGERLVGDLGDGRANPWVPLVFEWWDRWPTAGAAILTGLSRLLVVDVDPRNGGHHSLARLVADRPLPATRVVRTRSGGLHLYYRTTTLVKSDGAVLGAGVDVKSHRGLAVSPPTPGYVLLERRRIAQAPGWLVARCGRPARGGHRRGERRPFEDPGVQRVVEHAVQKILDAPSGERISRSTGRHGTRSSTAWTTGSRRRCTPPPKRSPLELRGPSGSGRSPTPDARRAADDRPATPRRRSLCRG